MASPTAATVKRLFALSGNRCAFPRCPLPLVDAPSGKVTGRICHIKANSKNGPRHDPRQPANARNGFENLLLLCPVHHDVVDSDLEAYTVERLLRMKADHEIANAGSAEPPDEVVTELIRVSQVSVTRGSVLLAFNQSGGQMAHSITNIFEQASQKAAAKLREKRVEIYGELWQLLLRAQGAVFQIASGFRRVPNVQSMSFDQFVSFVESTDFSPTERTTLIGTSATDRRATFNHLLWRKDVVGAREAWRQLHNYANGVRIYLSDELKAMISNAGALISRVVVHAEVSEEESNLNFQATDGWLKTIENEVARIEETMATELAAV